MPISSPDAPRGNSSDSLDRFLGGAVTIAQPRRGYRAGTDSLLLAAAIEAKPEHSLIEAGSGSGAALICAAHRLSGTHFLGIDTDIEAINRARNNLIMNGMAQRAQIEAHDIADIPEQWREAFDGAFANPPFFEPEQHADPARGRAEAVLASRSLPDWVSFMLHVIRPGAYMTMIHRAAELAKIAEALQGKAGQIEIIPLYPAPGQVAHRILVRARKSVRSGDVVLRSGMALRESRNGAKSQWLRQIEAGAALAWGEPCRF